MANKLKVCWISAGVSSFIAGYLVRETVDEFIYIDISDQHPDSLRFIKDCEKALGKPIKILRSSEYDSVESAIRSAGVIRMVSGFAPCTAWLKKRVRKQWELEHSDYEITYVWGFDLNEKRRAENVADTMSEFNHEIRVDFPEVFESRAKLERDIGASCINGCFLDELDPAKEE